MAKSDSSQYLWREISVAPDLLLHYRDDQGVWGDTNHIGDELQDLLQELASRLRWIVDNCLTTRQREVVTLLFYQGYTQVAAAAHLGLCQPTIHKTLHGNAFTARDGRKHGGAFRKLQRLSSEDPEISRILLRIGELRQELEAL